MKRALALAALAATLAGPLLAQEASRDPDARAAALVAQMTREEKIRLVHGHYPNQMPVRPAGVPQSAGYVPGIERLGIPAQRMTDASLGVAAAHQNENPATALPSGLALAATFDPRIAYTGGASSPTASSPPPSTSRSMRRRPDATWSTCGWTRPRCAKATCSRSRR